MKGGRPSPQPNNSHQESSPQGVPKPSKDCVPLREREGEERGSADTVPSPKDLPSSQNNAVKEKEEGEGEAGEDIEESGREETVPTPAPTQSYCSTGRVASHKI